MKELTLQALKEVEFEILKMFRSFCEENNIRYYLSNGTLLGAVKYKKFIPWDDDVDVFVPREDYNRLLSLFKDSDRYRLFAFEREPGFLYPFAKLCDMTTRKIEGNFDNGVELGVDIDVFPLDAWNGDLATARKELKYISKNRFCMGLAKRNKPDSINPVKRLIKGMVMLYCKMFGAKHYLKKIIRASSNVSLYGAQYVGCKAWCIYGEREIIPAEVFADTAEVEFEGEMFTAPSGYDKYLRSLYGNYIDDPPVEKQCTHHSFKAYQL